MSNLHHPNVETTPPADADAAARAVAHTRPVALVTGAARRIGRAIALELARAGFDIALHHRGADARSHADAAATAAELQALGARVEPFAADLSDPAATAALLPAVAGAFGRVDAVVNSASGFAYDYPTRFDPALLEALSRTNTAAPIVLAQALALQVTRQVPSMDASAEAPPLVPPVTPCVVNLLDQKLANPNPDYFSYTLTKAALQHATLLLARALAPAVRVCGVSPGITLLSGPMDEAEFARARTLTALGRPSTPDDIARAVRFLLESSAITGVDLAVDGGQHLSAQARDVLFLARRDAATAVAVAEAAATGAAAAGTTASTEFPPACPSTPAAPR